MKIKQEEHLKCLRCGRKLKTEQSKLLGFGKTCWEKYNSESKYKALFSADCLTKNSNMTEQKGR